LRPEFSKTCLVFWYTAGCAPANSQSGRLCIGSETSRFQIVESDKKGSWCIWWDLRGLKLKFKICRNSWITNDSATWPVVITRNGRNYLAQRDEPPTVTTEVFHYIKYLISGGIDSIPLTELLHFRTGLGNLSLVSGQKQSLLGMACRTNFPPKISSPLLFMILLNF